MSRLDLALAVASLGLAVALVAVAIESEPLAWAAGISAALSLGALALGELLDYWRSR